ncbi:hypothetical protein ACA910_018642 [Epithemia clementina (nom. ined.)]
MASSLSSVTEVSLAQKPPDASTDADVHVGNARSNISSTITTTATSVALSCCCDGAATTTTCTTSVGSSSSTSSSPPSPSPFSSSLWLPLSKSPFQPQPPLPLPLNGPQHQQQQEQTKNDQSNERRIPPPPPVREPNEATRLLQIGLPSILMRFSLVWIVPCTASAVGRQLGPVALAGFSLGSLVGNLTCLSILEGSLTAADTLVPRAFGAHNYREVARLVLRATLVSAALLSVPVLPLWYGTNKVLKTFFLLYSSDNSNDNNNENESSSSSSLQAAALAQVWVRIYLTGAPANLLFRVLTRLLLAQHKPWPLVVSSAIPALVLHPLWLRWLIPAFGFTGSAWSLVATQWTMLLCLLTLLRWGQHQKQQPSPLPWASLSFSSHQQKNDSVSSSSSSPSSSSSQPPPPGSASTRWRCCRRPTITTTTAHRQQTVDWLLLHPETWPSVNSLQFWKETCEWSKVVQFLSLAVGGVLSFNEWWFSEIMTMLAGQFGVEALDAHTIAYNIVPLLFMIPLGVGIGLAVRVGHLLAQHQQQQHDHARFLGAKSLALSCLLFTSVMGLVVAMILYLMRFHVISCFTQREDGPVFALALAIWPYFCCYVFLIFVMGISTSILRALGLQWRAAGITSITLYGITLPAVLYFAVYRNGGLVTQWKVVPICYVGLQIALILGYIRINWEEHAEKQLLLHKQQRLQQQHSLCNKQGHKCVLFQEEDDDESSKLENSFHQHQDAAFAAEVTPLLATGPGTVDVATF